MSQLPRPLHIVHGPDTDPEPSEIPAEPVKPAAAAPSLPAVRLSGGQLSVKDQSAAVIAYAFRMALARLRELSKRDGGPINALIESKPPSLREECDYAQSRAWVPPGHDGGLFEWLGILHHAIIGRPGVLLGNSISGLAHKPLRFWLLIFTVALVVLLVWKG